MAQQVSRRFFTGAGWQVLLLGIFVVGSFASIYYFTENLMASIGSLIGFLLVVAGLVMWIVQLWDKSKAASIALAITVFGVVGYGLVFAIAEGYGHATGYQAAEAKYKSQEESDRRVETTDLLGGSRLNICLDQVDKNFSQASGSVTTVDQLNAFTNAKQQQVQECQLRYPTH